MNKIKLKLDKHIVYLLDITKTMLDLDDMDNSKILNKLTSCIDVDLLTNYEIVDIKITSTKAYLKIITYNQGEILTKNTIKIKITKDKNNDVKSNVTCDTKILWNLFSKDLTLNNGENDINKKD